MSAVEDYRSLVQGLSSVDFSGTSIPCTLLLAGDKAFPVVVSTDKNVLIAASKYGKGRIVVMAHETYLNHSQLTTFLKNAISWLKPSSDAVIGVDSSLSLLMETLSTSGHSVQKVTDLNKGLGVFCTTGYDDSQAQDIVSFLQEGGGLLIGAQAWNWSSKHKNENVLRSFPGNKITSVAGIYFTGNYGERGNFNVDDNIPSCTYYHDVDFSEDLTFLLQGITDLDISGHSSASELLLHGPLTFPIGLTDKSKCFIGAAYYGRGRVVVETHEKYPTKPELKAFTLNAISWLDMGRNGKIGVNEEMEDLLQFLQNEGLPCVASNISPGLSVYCCMSYSDAEAEEIQKFVAEGGGLLIAGQCWYWSYSNPEVLSQYPGNKIINQFGLSILGNTVERKCYKALNPKEASETYHCPRAICQLLCELKKKAELKPPLTSWLKNLREDILHFMKLPASPIISVVQQELVQLVNECNLCSIKEQCPVKCSSVEAFLLCLAQEVSCLDILDNSTLPSDDLDIEPFQIQIDGTNPGDEAWRSTGIYLPAGKKATLVFPASCVGKGLQVQIGCHSDNLSAAEDFYRPPVVVRRKEVLVEKVVISSIWGGLIYIIVKGKSQLGEVQVTVYGGEAAPTFINGQTDLSSWLNTIRHYPAPWAELITENIILTVPSDVIRTLEDPEALMCQWDKNMLSIAELAVIPKKFLRPERIVADVQISAGWMHAGYPIMIHLKSAKPITNLETIKTEGIWGPIHELGHNQQQYVWEFPPHTTEATCNLWSVYVHETELGIPRDQAHSTLLPEQREACIKKYLQNGAKLEDWTVWTALETYLQLQEGFGWDPFKRLFAEYQTMSNVSDKKEDKMNLWAEKFSEAVNKNLTPFFQAWGWPIEETTSRKLSTLPAWEEDPMKKYAKPQ